MCKSQQLHQAHAVLNQRQGGNQAAGKKGRIAISSVHDLTKFGRYQTLVGLQVWVCFPLPQPRGSLLHRAGLSSLPVQPSGLCCG